MRERVNEIAEIVCESNTYLSDVIICTLSVLCMYSIVKNERFYYHSFISGAICTPTKLVDYYFVI